MNIHKYISLPVFLVSFAVGLFFIYAIGPELNAIYIYPNLHNYSKIQYKDASEQCFEFKPVSTECTFMPTEMPIQ